MTIAVHEGGNHLPDKIAFAKALADASLIPKQYQRNPANVLVAVEYGEALGIKPMVAMQEINVINGTPSLSASLMVALAREAGHKVRISGDAKSATCVIIRADDPGHEHTASWDEQKARDAGLWGRGHWAKDSGTMLKWRAVSECVRFACSEVLGGLKYTPEEVRDFSQPQTVVQQVPAPQPPASLADAIEAHKAEAAGITPGQSQEIGRLIRELGLSKDEYLDAVEGWIGRRVAGTAELSGEEVATVIAALSADPAPAETVDENTGEVHEAELVDGWPQVAEVPQ